MGLRMLRLSEVGTGRVIASRVEKADTVLRRLVGLMGRGGLDSEAGLWIVPCNSIHMFFMKFPIDCLFLDRDLCAVRLVHDIRPWQITSIVWKAHSVVELAAGTLHRTGCREGEVYRIDEVAEGD